MTDRPLPEVPVFTRRGLKASTVLMKAPSDTPATDLPVHVRLSLKRE